MNRLLTALISLFLAASSLWAGDAIVSQLSHRRFTTHDGLPQMQTETVWQDSKGYIWIGTLSGFVRYDGLSLTPFLKGRRENIVAFTETEEGVSALGFRRRWLVKGDKADMYPIDPSQQWLSNNGGGNDERHWLLNNFNSPDLPPRMLLLEDVNEENRQLAEITASGIRPVLRGQVFDRMTPDRKMFIDGDDIYIPTEQGLYVVSNKQWRLLTAKDDIFTLIRSGNTLYALAADGIYTLEGHRLTMTASYPFEAPDYGLIARQGQDGHLFIADAHNLYQYDGKKIDKLATGFNLIKSLLVDRWGRLWMATYQGVYLFFRNDFTLHRMKDDNDVVRALCDDGQGNIVMGTLNGTLLIDGQQRHAEEGQFFNPSATRIGQTIYMVGRGDVAAIDDGTVRWLGMPQDRYQFTAQASNWLIIGTRQRILAYDTREQRTDTLTEEIMHPWCAAADGNGNLWVGSSSGLYRISGWQQGRPQTELRQKRVVTTMDSDSHGNIVFATDDSLFLIRHGQVEAMNGDLPLLNGHEIRSLHHSPRGFLVMGTIDGMLVARINDDCHVTAAQWFDHTNGFTLIEPMNTPMAETDDGTIWIAGLEEMASFQPERLMAFDPATTIIEGDKPWWQRWWAWLMMAVAAAALGWWTARRMERRRHRRAMERLQREKRQKELQIQAIRLKAIPHFHANVLASIEYFLMNNSGDEAIHYLKLYSDFTNQTLSDIDRPARSIDEELDYIRLYLELEKLRLGERLAYTIAVGDDVNRQTLLPTMLLFTYCQNAVKHGIANKPGGGHIDIFVEHDGADVVVKVKDDGVGRAKAAELNKNTTRQGLLLLDEQIALYNQANKRPIRQSVTDLYDEQHRPAGTCFEACIPTEYRYIIGCQE